MASSSRRPLQKASACMAGEAKQRGHTATVRYRRANCWGQPSAEHQNLLPRRHSFFTQRRGHYLPPHQKVIRLWATGTGSTQLAEYLLERRQYTGMHLGPEEPSDEHRRGCRMTGPPEDCCVSASKRYGTPERAEEAPGHARRGLPDLHHAQLVGNTPVLPPAPAESYRPSSRTA